MTEIDVDELTAKAKELELEVKDHEDHDDKDTSTTTAASSGAVSSSTTTATTTSLEDDDDDDEDTEDSKPSATTKSGTTTTTTTTTPTKSSTSIPKTRSSIKLATLSEEIPLKNNKKAWKILPLANVHQINQDKITRGATLPANYNDPAAIFALMSGGKTQAQVAAGQGNTDTTVTSKGVNFQSVQVRSYRQTLSDNPSVSYGPPIGLDWNYQQEQDVHLDDFESSRQNQRRPYAKLGLNYYQRKSLLESSGSSPKEVKQAQKKANHDKFQRAVTKYCLPSLHLQDALESAGRKTKRIFSVGKKKKGGKEQRSSSIG